MLPSLEQLKLPKHLKKSTSQGDKSDTLNSLPRNTARVRQSVADSFFMMIIIVNFRLMVKRCVVYSDAPPFKTRKQNLIYNYSSKLEIYHEDPPPQTEGFLVS